MKLQPAFSSSTAAVRLLLLVLWAAEGSDGLGKAALAHDVSLLCCEVALTRSCVPLSTATSCLPASELHLCQDPACCLPVDPSMQFKCVQMTISAHTAHPSGLEPSAPCMRDPVWICMAPEVMPASPCCRTNGEASCLC